MPARKKKNREEFYEVVCVLAFVRVAMGPCDAFYIKRSLKSWRMKQKQKRKQKRKKKAPSPGIEPGTPA